MQAQVEDIRVAEPPLDTRAQLGWDMQEINRMSRSLGPWDRSTSLLPLLAPRPKDFRRLEEETLSQPDCLTMVGTSPP